MTSDTYPEQLLVHPHVTAGSHRDVLSGALVHENFLDTRAESDSLGDIDNETGGDREDEMVNDRNC